MPEKQNKKMIVTISATVAVVFLFGWLVIFFLGGKVKKSFEDFQKEKLNFVVLEEKKEKISKIQKELPDLEEEKRSLDSMLIKKDENVPFLRKLEEVAGLSSCSIEIESVDLKKVKFEKKTGEQVKKTDDLDSDTESKKAGTPAVPQEKKEDEMSSLYGFPSFSVEATGTFSSILNFIEALENMPFFIRPLIIDVSSSEKKVMASASGALVSGTQASDENKNGDGKNVKMIITFVIYGK